MKYAVEVVMTIEAQDELDAAELAWQIVGDIPLSSRGLESVNVLSVD